MLDQPDIELPISGFNYEVPAEFFYVPVRDSEIGALSGFYKRVPGTYNYTRVN
jgi:hypothetical protein